MKYKVVFERTVCVEAETPKQAEEEAFKELDETVEQTMSDESTVADYFSAKVTEERGE